MKWLHEELGLSPNAYYDPTENHGCMLLHKKYTEEELPNGFAYPWFTLEYIHEILTPLEAEEDDMVFNTSWDKNYYHFEADCGGADVKEYIDDDEHLSALNFLKEIIITYNENLRGLPV